MSAYIVSDETISVIAKAFIEYGVHYDADNYSPSPLELIFVNETPKAIGRSLLAQNYESVNCVWSDKIEPIPFFYKDIEINYGLVYGCIKEYDYQACETPNYQYSKLYFSLKRLKNEIVNRLFRELEMSVPYGYGGHDTLNL